MFYIKFRCELSLFKKKKIALFNKEIYVDRNLTSISDTIAATASMGNNLAQNIINGVGTYSNTSTYAVGEKIRK